MLGGVFAVAVVNAVAPDIAASLSRHGLGEALGLLFGLDLAVVAAAAVGLALILGDWRAGTTAGRGDLMAAGLAGAVLLLPHPAAGWAAAGVLGVYGLVVAKGSTGLRAGAAVFVVLAVYDVIAGRLLMNVLGPFLTTSDAMLTTAVLTALGQDVARHGNVITTGMGHDLVVIGLCTTFRAFWYGFVLCFAFTRWVRPAWRASEVLTWAALALAVLVLNITRLTLFGLDLFYYDALHGEAGGAMFNMAVIVVTLAVSALGVRHEFGRSTTGR